MNHTRNVLFAVLVLLASVVVASGIAMADADNGVSIDHVQFDMPTKMLSADGTSSAESVVGYITYADGTVSPYFAFDVKDGKWSGQVHCPDITAGTHTLTMFVSSTAVVSVQFTVSDIKIEPAQSQVSVYVGAKTDVACTLTACKGTDVSVSSSNSAVARVSAMSADGKVTIEGVETGTAKIILTCSGVTAEISVKVTTKPAEEKVYIFEISMDVDADKVKSSKYTQSILESGFTIQATATNAADALAKACSANGIPLVQYTGGELKGWITSMFGLGDVNLGNGEWKYWAQYHEGSYNSYTLGYYTDGGTFQLIYKITKEMDVNPDKKDDASQKTNTDGSKESSQTTTSKDSQGNDVQETVGTKENPDGSKVQTESNTVTRADGSSTTTKTETEIDSLGNVTGKTETVSETTVIKNQDGTTTEKTTETVVKQDGSQKESESVVTVQKDGSTQEQKTEKSTGKDGSVVETTSTSVTSKDGTVKTEGTSSSKDASGNASGTTEFTETVQTSSGKTTTTRSESYKDADGKSSGSKDIVTEQKTTSSGTETVRKESVKDADGNAVSSTESSTTVKTKTVIDGSNTVTTSSEVSKNADGKTTSSREEVLDVTVLKNSTKVQSTVVEKDSEGKQTLSRELSTESKTNSDGSVTTTVSQKETSPDRTVDTSSKTVRAADGSESTESTRTTSTSEGTVEEKVDSSKKVSDGTTSETRNARETVKDAKGDVKSETEKVTESVVSENEKSSYSSEQVKKDGSVELKESSTVESTDGSVKSETDVSVKDGEVQKAESVTSVTVSEGTLDAESVKTAVEQSKASIERTSVKTEEVSKTLKVEGPEGIRIVTTPEALVMVSEHGAELEVKGVDGGLVGSFAVDTGVCDTLSKDADGDIDLRMEPGRAGDLTEAQKQTVQDSYYIVLVATVGEKKVHELGGQAVVSFEYTPVEGQDVSRLCIYYIDEDGNSTRMDSGYDPESGIFSMRTDHFSVFMIGEVEEEESGDGGDGNAVLIAGVLVAIVAAVVVAAAILRTRRA